MLAGGRVSIGRGERSVAVYESERRGKVASEDTEPLERCRGCWDMGLGESLRGFVEDGTRWDDPFDAGTGQS